MEGTVILEQLIGVILSALTILFSVAGPVLYYSFKFTSTKVDELRLQISNFIRMTLEDIIKRVYRLIMQTAVLIQTLIDIIEMVTAIGVERAQQRQARFREMTPIERLKSKEFLEWLSGHVLKRTRELKEGLLRRVLRKIGRKIAKGSIRFAQVLEPRAKGLVFRGIARVIFKRSLERKAVALAVGLIILSIIGRNIATHYLMMEAERKEFPEVGLLLLLAGLTAIFGGFVITMAEIIFRLVIPTMDKFFYTPVSEGVMSKDTNTTLRKIARRIEFCWKAFGIGRKNVNYMRTNPTPCSITLISSHGDPISIRDIIDEMKKIEGRYLERNQTFFSNGRFVFIIKECNGTTGKCDNVKSFRCIGKECWSDSPPDDLDVLSKVNLNIYYTSDELITQKVLSVGIMYISFGECVPWDTYTAEGMESPFWEKEKFGEMTPIHFAAIAIGAESLLDLRCLLKDTLYITFLIPKEKNITVVFEEGT